MKRFLPFGIIFGVALFALGAGTMLYRAKRETVVPPMTAEAASTDAGAKPPHVRGAAKAVVVMEEFGDLQCPPCATLSVALKKFEHDYTGRLQVVFRHFPMAMHNHAIKAAQATEAAGLQGRFWEMSDLLYEGQNTWSKATEVQPLFEQYAQQIGLDLARFKADMDGQPVLARIGLDSQRGRSLGVNATPTLFLNNQRIPQQYMNEGGLRSAIDAILAGRPPFPEASSTPSPTQTAESPTPAPAPSPAS